MAKGRVLVVEDLPDVRATLSGVLSDAGFEVCAAGSRAAALDRLGSRRVHVAVLDVRLDESDEDNRDGLLLMRDIRRIDPTIAVIILTGHADVQMVQDALQPDRDGVAPAFGFLQKNQITELPEYVQRALDLGQRINTALDITDPSGLIPQLPDRLEFGEDVVVVQEPMEQEARDLLAKLFRDCERIEVQPMRHSHSGAAVLEVHPHYPQRGPGERVIAKIGAYPMVMIELGHYRTLVHGTVGGHRLPNTLEHARTRSLAGVVYSFAGLGESTDLATCFPDTSAGDALTIVDNLFGETCRPWHAAAGPPVPDYDLREFYLGHYRLTPRKLADSLSILTSGRHPFRWDAGGQRILLKDQVLPENPILFVQSADLRCATRLATIHGDLNGYNVLIDRHRETWLIDFAATCKGPLSQDFAALETFARMALAGPLDPQAACAWEQALLAAPDLRTAELPPELHRLPGVAKVHPAVLAIRRFALDERAGESPRAYLIGLLFNALKRLTIMDLPAAQRDHALICAALVAHRLQREGSTTRE